MDTQLSHDHFWQPEQTIIVIDWDDTLFPTTWLEEDMHVPLDKMMAHGHELREPVDLVTKRAQDLLAMACKHSTYVVIVTLAKDPWVENCTNNFCPALARSITDLGIRVVYARQYSDVDVGYNKLKFMSSREQTAYWTGVKAAAIACECGRCYSQYPGQTWKNVISIGDSEFERQGTRDVIRHWCITNAQTAYQLPRTKTIKFLDDPTCEQVADQLKLLTDWLPDLVARDWGFNIDFDEAGAEDYGGLEEFISCAGETPPEGRTNALVEGRLWKLKTNGDPSNEEHWLRRRMWLSDSGQIWYESLRAASAVQFLPGVYKGAFSASALDEDRTGDIAMIDGKPIFAMRIDLLIPYLHGGNVDPFQTEPCFNAASRETYLGAESEQVRDDWIKCIRRFAPPISRSG